MTVVLKLREIAQVIVMKEKKYQCELKEQYVKIKSCGHIWALQSM